ncbi:MAG: hypothetical protein FJ403_19230 [Verrucomicrobia bacterium]|nr:hypothetical protein [Verrucomicrobiota bacterium]
MNKEPTNQSVEGANQYLQQGTKLNPRSTLVMLPKPASAAPASITLANGLAMLLLAAFEVRGAEPIAHTSLENPSVRFTAPGKPYVVLRRGSIEAVIVDNRAVDDAVLPGHRAGYHGIGSLKHDEQPRNLCVPAYAGLNFEHIHDGAVQTNKVLFEPRHAPMELRVIDSHTAELYQAPTPHWGLESCMRYQLLEDETIQLTFECIARRDTYKNGYIGLFWASYIDQPESRDTHFLIPPGHTETGPKWVRASSPQHGVLAAHRAENDNRAFAHDANFPLTLVFNYSNHRYAEPWFLGVCRQMAFVQIFQPQDKVRLSQSPSGGGAGNPAWDFQWILPDYKIGQRYRLVMRALYTINEANPLNPFESQDRLLAAVRRAGKFE